jgi:TetR/AcrR family transcriptional regulator, transcriptional repressor for nem operon
MEKDQREALLDAGVRLVRARGLAATGVRDIAMAAGVPQGSFTNHFRSKAAFGILVLDRYAERIDAIMRETLSDDTLAPAERLIAYIDRIEESAAEADWRRGCMVSDLAGEIAFHDDALRARLRAVLAQQSAQFESLVRLARPRDEDGAADLGAFLLAAWHGTLLRVKVERNATALDRFRRMLETLLDPSKRSSRQALLPKSSPSASRESRCASRCRGPSNSLRNASMRASRLNPPGRKVSANNRCASAITASWARIAASSSAVRSSKDSPFSDSARAAPLLPSLVSASPIVGLDSGGESRWKFRPASLYADSKRCAGPERPSAASPHWRTAAAFPCRWPTAEGPVAGS